MDLLFFILLIAFWIGFFALIVDSQVNFNFNPPPLPPPPPPPPSPPPPSPPPPQSSPPPPLSPLYYLPSPPYSPPPRHLHPRKELHPPPVGLRDHRKSWHRSRSRHGGLNTGKKVGLMFIGVVTILQVCVVAFLFIQRRLIFKAGNA